MIGAMQLRLAMHDMTCMSTCGHLERDQLFVFPPDMPDDERAEHITRDTVKRIDHAKYVWSRFATEFRKTTTQEQAETLFHDRMCRAGSACKSGRMHLSGKASRMIQEWRA